MECPKCGSALSSLARFCGSCGSSLTKKCSVCYAESGLSSDFCGNCGARFEGMVGGIPLERALDWRKGFKQAGWWTLPQGSLVLGFFGDEVKDARTITRDLLKKEDLPMDPDDRYEPWLFCARVSPGVNWAIDRIRFIGRQDSVVWPNPSIEYLVATRTRVLLFRVSKDQEVLLHWFYTDMTGVTQDRETFTLEFASGRYQSNRHDESKLIEHYGRDLKASGIQFKIKTSGPRFVDMAFLMGHTVSGKGDEVYHLAAASNIASSRQAQVDFLEVFSTFFNEVIDVVNDVRKDQTGGKGRNDNSSNRDIDWRGYNKQLVNLLMEMAGTSDFDVRRKIFRSKISMIFDVDFFPSLLQLLESIKNSPEKGDAIGLSIQVAIFLEINEFLTKNDVRNLSAAGIVAYLLVRPTVADLEANLRQQDEDTAERTMSDEIGNSFLHVWPRLRQVRSDFYAHLTKLVVAAKEREDVRDAKAKLVMEEAATKWEKMAGLYKVMDNLLILVESDNLDLEALKFLTAKAEGDAESLMHCVSLLQHSFDASDEKDKAQRVIKAFMAVIMAKG